MTIYNKQLYAALCHLICTAAYETRLLSPCSNFQSYKFLLIVFEAEPADRKARLARCGSSAHIPRTWYLEPIAVSDRTRAAPTNFGHTISMLGPRSPAVMRLIMTRRPQPPIVAEPLINTVVSTICRKNNAYSGLLGNCFFISVLTRII